MGLSFGDYALCDSEFSCFPPLIDDLVRPRLGLFDIFITVWMGWSVHIFAYIFTYMNKGVNGRHLTTSQSPNNNKK
jgi:hypothetical protein